MKYKMDAYCGLAACRRDGLLRRGQGPGHHQGGHSAFSFGHDGHQRDDAEGHRS